MELINAKDQQQFDENRFTKINLFQKGKSTAFLLNFLPGQTLPAHPHPNAHVYLYVLEGTGICKIDDEVQPIGPNDVIHAENEQIVSIENNGKERLSIYVVLAKE
ncbi:cupin domain-containing protein [Bacillus niameyensis]|uniref:cupin domain-containing protein n=1 Tax=Bacillus niameyensis TaxID=1522308 RepID=UPI000780C36D|nr:cupin domain-containing protein [Bacillus niameyensis]